MELKTFEIKSAKDRKVTFMASDESVDRDRDIIKADGWVYENFIKSGSIIYGHDPREKLPVARPTDVRVVDNQLLITAQFAEKGTSDFNDAVYSLVEQGILRGVSVGFQPLEQPSQNEYGGRTFTKQELLELSLTPIPSNANARVLVKDFSEEIQDKLLTVKETETIIEDEVQEEEVIAEPEPKTLSESEVKFVELVDRLKQIL